VSLVLSRQSLPTFDRQILGSASGVARGGYVLADAVDGAPDVLLIATGSEVALCLAAREQLALEGVRARVVSLPPWELFERQDTDYRDRVLPPSVTARVSVEAGSPLGWERYTGRHGAILALRSFGQSAPGPVVQAHFGFDVAHVIAAARAQCLQPPPQRSTPPQGTP
jgi:transketolase